MKIFGLLDCNNFFVSCERIFDPSLQDRPTVVLSNNDACIISRSDEAKALGIKMGEPVFKCEYLLSRHKVAICSANFTLYADISQRIMTELYKLVADIEVYSIDEAFILLGDTRHLSLEEINLKAMQIQSHIERAIGVPVTLGIASTKVLAKLAATIGKKNKERVFSLYFGENSNIDKFLAELPVGETWGIGWNYRRFLQAHRINTVLDLKNANEFWIKSQMGINGLKTVMELRGKECFPLNQQDYTKPTRSIINSRSFGTKVQSLDALKEALANFTANAAHKLRKQKLLAKSVYVFLQSSSEVPEKWYGKRHSREAVLNHPSSYTPTIIKLAHQLLEELYQPGLYYRKAGIVLYGLIPETSVQLSFNSKPDNFKSEQCLRLIDDLNDQFGNRTIFWASMGINKTYSAQEFEYKQKDIWQAKQLKRSPRYTSNWQELPLIS